MCNDNRIVEISNLKKLLKESAYVLFYKLNQDTNNKERINLYFINY